MPGYSHILLAVDFSRNSHSVAQQALQMQQAFQARLSLVHVIEYMQVDLSNELLMPQELELDRELEEAAHRKLETFARSLGIDESECLVAQGSTRREILRLANENAVDLIVIGSHGREGIQLLLGSTANAVLHGAPCDVLAVRINK